MPPEPFQVEFYIAGGAIVRFTLLEETLRNHPHPTIRAMATQGGRDGLASAAAFWLEATFDRKKASNPTSIIDDDGAWWLVAPSAVLAIRLFDPTAATPPMRVGFVVSGAISTE
jgi:hypothetical protein